ncbi:hypothetical protein TNCV_4910671 [Trichonephila clavipes]|nr:hypothetical protein TNCV_4910671 [Trichonephila clavipes]
MGLSGIYLMLQRLLDMTSYCSARQASCYKILFGSSELPLASLRETSFSSVTGRILGTGNDSALNEKESILRMEDFSICPRPPSKVIRPPEGGGEPYSLRAATLRRFYRLQPPTDSHGLYPIDFQIFLDSQTYSDQSWFTLTSIPMSL